MPRPNAKKPDWTPIVNAGMFKAPDMDQIDINKCYSITISPPDWRDTDRLLNMNIIHSSEFLVKGIRKHHDNFQNNLFKDNIGYLELYPELSHTGRLHYHGYIAIKDPPMFYHRDCYTLMNMGIIEIDVIEDDIKWMVYTQKQKNYMKQYCEKAGLEYPMIIFGNGKQKPQNGVIHKWDEGIEIMDETVIEESQDL